ncbi:GNAT family N-acetyltransferase [Pseudomonas entomophila]|uniref:GNAT family N-acetyltransferase n=1 Tax=Pseudomonas entomophila TaxID=312306 RepID=UPI0015E2E01B|nr:GNAT family N-acetyltransferase [Pseudomonas entomophila]MBA1192751.1 GNAT family N-acetyltransferase [Pseudomonas entomophila]
MPETTAPPARLCLLDRGYRRETRALLFEAYRREPVVGHLLDADRPGFERRLRTVIRAWVRQHYYLQLPALGLMVGDDLIGVALITPPLRRLGVTDSWIWRLWMWSGVGLRRTRRYLDYQWAINGCLASPQVHLLPWLGIDPRFQGRHYGEQLLQAVHAWCAEDTDSHGVVLATGNAHYLDFCLQQGYEEVGEVALGPVRERVFHHPLPLSAEVPQA